MIGLISRTAAKSSISLWISLAAISTPNPKIKNIALTATQSSHDLKCLCATQSDLTSLVNLQYAACEGSLFHDAIWGPNTLANRQKARDRLHKKWQATPNYSVVKCIDERTGALMAWCIWDIIPPKITREEAIEEDVMNDCAWLAEGKKRDLGRGYLVPAIKKRWDVLHGREYLLLTNLCTALEWRKKGAATALVEWGLRKATEMGIPAYCEASEMGLHVYESLGFEGVGVVETRIDGKVVDECAVMVAGR